MSAASWATPASSTAKRAPTYSENAAVNLSTFGPVVIHPDRNVSATSAISSSPSDGRAKGRKLLLIGAAV